MNQSNSCQRLEEVKPGQITGIPIYNLKSILDIKPSYSRRMRVRYWQGST